MELVLLPHTKPLAEHHGPGGALNRVQIDKYITRCPVYGVRLTRVVEELSREWPRLAGAVDKVRANGSLRPPTYAHSRVATFRTVSGYIDVSKHAMRSTISDDELLGLNIIKRSVGSTFEDVIVHEWGHLLLNVDLLRRYHNLDQGIEDFVSLIERYSGVSREAAAEDLSGMAQINSRELIAEAFVAARAGSKDPFPVAVLVALEALWTPPADQWPGWSI